MLSDFYIHIDHARYVCDEAKGEHGCPGVFEDFSDPRVQDTREAMEHEEDLANKAKDEKKEKDYKQGEIDL